MDIVEVSKALETLMPLLNDYDMEQLKRQVGNAVIKFHEDKAENKYNDDLNFCLLYTSPSPRDGCRSRMPSSA